jgi:valine--pyruvate aminotransferase
MLMLVGGNPGRIPELQQRFRERMRSMLDDGEAFDRLVGDYGPPQGHPGFIRALATLLHEQFGWELGPENIAITNGSQSASFMLFNMLAGPDDRGRHRRIVLPLTPEYIGYADQGVVPDLFRASRPSIELLDAQQFKYRVDFDAVHVDESVAAICVSRPTNPTGNVLTDEEMETLLALAKRHEVPLIVDNAYGLPFPGIVFCDATPVWNENVIVCMSLSKLGLPGVRTGIVIAEPGIIRAITGMNAIINLSTGGFGPELALEMVSSGEILHLGRDVVKPFYQRKAQAAVERLRRDLAGHPFRVHRPEGAIFLWLWFDGLPITGQELYQRLRQRGVLVIPGQHFFPGLEDDWRHRHECIRVNYSLADDQVQAGLGIIAEEVKRAYSQA